MMPALHRGAADSLQSLLPKGGAEPHRLAAQRGGFPTDVNIFYKYSGMTLNSTVPKELQIRDS